MYDSIVFDFDGLILDTETPLFVAWEQTFEHFGVPPIGLDEWTKSLGLHDDDPAMLNPLDRLSKALDRQLTADEIQRVRRAYRDDLLDHQPVLPGVEQLLDQADASNIPLAIASSSPNSWIERHLRPRGLLERFSILSCAGDGVPGKPDPAVYLGACQALGVDPRRSLALEDSPHGTAAAKAAGMTCFAVPTPISRHLDFIGADRVLTSLEQVTLAEPQTSPGEGGAVEGAQEQKGERRQPETADREIPQTSKPRSPHA